MSTSISYFRGHGEVMGILMPFLITTYRNVNAKLTKKKKKKKRKKVFRIARDAVSEILIDVSHTVLRTL